MSEHTKTPWIVEESRHHIYIWDSEGRVQVHYHRGLASGVEAEHAANARHIVHCVNNMPKVVEALRKVTNPDWNDMESVDDDVEQARTLLAALEAEKGGEL